MRDADRKVADPGRFVRGSFMFACFASLLLFSQGEAAAGNILVFGQAAGGNTVTLTNDGSGNETISATDVAIAITTLGGLPTSPPIPAFFTLNATNTGPATVSGTDVTETFSGSFTITSDVGGGGINYLSGSFADSFHGVLGGNSASITASSPPNTVIFTSDVPLTLGPISALSFSFANLSPSLKVVNGSAGVVGSTTMSVSATFSAAVPEPSALVLGSIAGLVVIGCGGLRRRTRARVSA